MLSTVRHLHTRLHRRWVPKWFVAFEDKSHGGFYERVGHSFRKLETGQKRLLTQCRQLAVYAHAAGHIHTAAHYKGRINYQDALQPHIDFFYKKYMIRPSCGSVGQDHTLLSGRTSKAVNEGLAAWRFSVTDSGEEKDNTLDLYGHAFVIFTLTYLDRYLGDKQARTCARQTLNLINHFFRIDGQPGYAEALGPNLKPITVSMRRQDPHMHLLEACLSAYEHWEEDCYLKTASYIIDLFIDYFTRIPENICSPDTCDRRSALKGNGIFPQEVNDPISPEIGLIEYFDDFLRPHPEEGHKVKPGHYFEWIWLICKYFHLWKKHCPGGQSFPPHSEKLCNIAVIFLEKGNRHGYDPLYGGIYDFVDHHGRVLSDTKRVWPFAEALKAHALMLDAHNLSTDLPTLMGKQSIGGEEGTAYRKTLKDRMAEMVRIFNQDYIDDRGYWTETINQDLSPATDYMPGTTPYHLYFGISEAYACLSARGPSKSLISGSRNFIYGFWRQLSDITHSLLKTRWTRKSERSVKIEPPL